MKVVILAGGKGTRLSEETTARPKPMVEIGGRPMLWHIMQIYAHYGFDDFVILLGYKGYMIKEYFANYSLHQSDVTVDLSNNSTMVHSNASEPWRVTLVDTGEDTLTGSRIKKARRYFDDEAFLLTYGDGVSNADIPAIIAHHKAAGRAVTMTAVQPDGRFGTFEQGEDGLVKRFLEKPKGDGSWINGGFFVCDPSIFRYIPDEDVMLEAEPFANLVRDQQLTVYKHHGFWKCMDTVRDRTELEQMWESGEAKWKLGGPAR